MNPRVSLLSALELGEVTEEEGKAGVDTASVGVGLCRV